MPDPLTLTDDDLRHYMSLDGFTLERIAKLYHVPLSKVEKQWARIERGRQEEDRRQARRLQRAASDRPFPPEALCDPQAMPGFAPAPDLLDWVRATFIEDGPLCNPDHTHLHFARLAFLWTNLPNGRQGKKIVGQAEIPMTQGSKWAKGRADYQLWQWFGEEPHFLITLYTGYASDVDDASFCSLTEHELYHCGQAQDEFGVPKYNKEGFPVFAMRGHDAEEFVGVTRRYGVGASAGGVAELVAAAGRAPSVAVASIAQACGTCLK